MHERNEQGPVKLTPPQSDPRRGSAVKRSTSEKSWLSRQATARPAALKASAWGLNGLAGSMRFEGISARLQWKFSSQDFPPAGIEPITSQPVLQLGGPLDLGVIEVEPAAGFLAGTWVDGRCR